MSKCIYRNFSVKKKFIEKNGNEPPLLALLLPSKGRLFDLLLTLLFTPLKPPDGLRVRFFVVANYSSTKLKFIKLLFSKHVSLIDERTFEKRGANGAYNYAFETAKENGAYWVALWADDLLPEKNNWLEELNGYLRDGKFQFGIFSTDEGNHKGYYGWNIGAGYPCAHFYVCSINALPGYLLNPALKGFAGDNEIAISRIKSKIPISLLPIKVIHQPTVNATRLSRTNQLELDIEQLYTIHPELRGRLDGMILKGDLNDSQYRFIPDEGLIVDFTKKSKTLAFNDAMSMYERYTPPLRIRFLYTLRIAWNRMMRLPSVTMQILSRENA